LINVPIFVNGRVWGVFEVDDVKARRFDKDDENFMASLAHLLGSAIARKRAEEADQGHVESRAANAQKNEVLIRELHHRVKNNFQLIISLLLLQQRRITDKSAREVIGRVAEKVTSIAMAHEQLSASGASTAVRMVPYLTSLIARIAPARPEILVEHEFEELSLSLDRAVLAGLIVNEAFTNAEKHGFRERQAGAIRVMFKREVQDLRLTISDNGAGMQTPRDGAKGLILMDKLVEQLSGRIEIESAAGKGLTIQVTFPEV
jgi:two-component system, sensor histidine kinase PdtaS